MTRISVIVHPNSKKPRVEPDLTGMLHVYVSQPPLEGKANAAVREALVAYYNVRKSDVYLVSGERSKHKVFTVRS